MWSKHPRDPHPASARGLASDDGFTIVEVVIASVILVVGVLGILTLLTGALRTTAATGARVGATNLARELVEGTRGLDYDDMVDTLVRARLQDRGLGSGSPWTIQRRGVTYTIAVSSCAYDNPGDKLAAPPPAGMCTPQPTGAIGDSNGDDFRRTTFQISWREAGAGQRSLTQTTLVVNPTGGLGPRIVSFTPVTQTITANISSATVVWTTTLAQSLHWSVDDGASAGNSAGSTSFTSSWDIGSSGSAGAILDGSYQITAQPVDDRDIAGEGSRANVVLNRRQPYAPPSLAGGHDTRLDDWVDLQWSPNSERDILGYRVVWAGPDRSVGNGDDAQVCPASGDDTMLAPDELRRLLPAQRRHDVLHRRRRPRPRQRAACRRPPGPLDRCSKHAPAGAGRFGGADGERPADALLERAVLRRRELLPYLPRRHPL